MPPLTGTMTIRAILRPKYDLVGAIAVLTLCSYAPSLSWRLTYLFFVYSYHAVIRPTAWRMAVPSNQLRTISH